MVNEEKRRLRQDLADRRLTGKVNFGDLEVERFGR